MCATNDHYAWDEEFSISPAMDVRADVVLQREITEDIEIELIPLAHLRAGSAWRDHGCLFGARDSAGE